MDPLTLDGTSQAAKYVMSQLCDVIDGMAQRTELRPDLVVRLNLARDKMPVRTDGPPLAP